MRSEWRFLFVVTFAAGTAIMAFFTLDALPKPKRFFLVTVYLMKVGYEGKILPTSQAEAHRLGAYMFKNKCALINTETELHDRHAREKEIRLILRCPNRIGAKYLPYYATDCGQIGEAVAITWVMDIEEADRFDLSALWKAELHMRCKDFFSNRKIAVLMQKSIRL